MDWGSSFQSDDDFGSDVERKIVELIVKDEKCKFVDLVKSQLGTENSDKSGSFLRPLKLLDLICHYDAVSCAAALVGGEIGLTVDLSTSLRSGLFPLHHAAMLLSPRLIQLFSDFGAQADVRCNNVRSIFHGLLPLDIALESISNKIVWTPRQSVFKLLFMLLGEGMLEPSETVNFLASKTSNVQRFIHKYAEEGKLIQFAALLIVALQSIEVSTMYITKDDCKFGEGMTLRRFVSTEIALLIDEEHKLTVNGGSKLAQLCKEKRMVMTPMLLLLEIFERIGNDMIRRVLPYAYDVGGRGSTAERIAVLLKNSGFSLTGEDADILKYSEFFWAGRKQQPKLLGYSSSPNSSNKVTSFDRKQKCSGKLGEHRSQPMYDSIPSYLQPHGVFNSLSIPKVPIQKRRLKFSESWHEKQQSLFSDVRSFHTLRSFKAYLGSELYATMDARAKEKTKAIEQHLPKFIWSKKWSSFALVMKKGIRHI